MADMLEMMPPELQMEYTQLARRRQLADALAAQSFQGQQGIQAGRFYVPPSPLSPLVQTAQAFAGAKIQDQADTAAGDITKRYQSGLADEVARIAALRQGKTIAPDMQEVQQANDQGTPEPRPTTTGDPRAAIQAALLSQYAPVRQMGILEHKTFENEQTRANDREARLHERILSLDAAAANQSAAREDRVRAAQEASNLRRDLATMQDTTRREIAASRQPPSPSFTEIVDPNDPTRMLRIDGRVYKGGSLGAPGVSGISGKEPTAAKKAEQIDAGRENVSSLVTQLRDYYTQLSESGGISDPSKGLLRNVGAGIASSGPGQMAGRLIGTKDQSIRNSIAQQRPLLLNAIKNATGMSAKQMDSNAELKLYLAAATDPTLDIKANLDALDNLDRLFGTAGKLGPKPPKAGGGAVPEGVDPKVWAVMTPQEKALWAK